VPNSPSWSRPPAPQPLDVRALARRQALRRPAGPRPAHDPLAAGASGEHLHDELGDDLDDLDDELDDGPASPGAGPGARHRAGIAPWRQEVRQRAADRVPPGVRALRWRVGPSAARGAAVVAVLVLLGLVLAAYLTWPRPDAASAVPVGQAVPPRTAAVAVTSAAGATAGTSRPSAAGAAGGAAAPTSSPTASVVVVHVAGQVVRPGLVTLPAGSRVAEALAAAGGARDTADLDRVNLARPLVDGEQVLVPAPGEAAPAVAAPAAGAAAPGGAAAEPVDLNTATEQDLDGLPGVGEVLARRILAWRSEHTRFSDVEELGEVPGIGPKLLAGIRPLVRV